MATATPADKAATPELASRFEALRAREHDLIVKLLDVLPRVDGLPSELITQTRDALFHADTPFLLVLMGPFSAGKSSLINALLGMPNLLQTGVTPTTDRITILRYGDDVQRVETGDTTSLLVPAPFLKTVSLVDTPGLESVFKTHEEQTRKFLHRSDAVLLVMLATQAMTARTSEYLQTLKAYGKRVIIVLNQADLIADADVPALRAYVIDQSRSILGVAPEVWLTSARQALDAGTGESQNEELWENSGLDHFSNLLDQELSDADRLRQKLTTPLRIAQHVLGSAEETVRGHQQALDQYQKISDNLEHQLSVMKSDQDKVVRTTAADSTALFMEAGERGRSAIREATAFRHTPGAAVRGMWELVGLAGIFRREPKVIAKSLAAHKAFEPLDRLSPVVEALGPKLEGKDMQDLDSLVAYGRREVDALPPVIRGRLIGELRAPAKYDRSPLLNVNKELVPIEEAVRLEPTRAAERILSAARVYLAGWEIICLVFLFVFFWARPEAEGQPALWVGLALIALVAAVSGLVVYMVRGRGVAGQYASAFDRAGNQYAALLAKAGDQQVTYAMELRREVTSPLLRLVAAQTTALAEQQTAVKSAQDAAVALAADVAALK
ncbi:MAG: dynamin family protein [Anaerolineae bacterium]